MRSRVYRSVALLGWVCLILTIFPAVALADYPEKPVTFIAVWPAGGTVDMTARVLTEAAKKHLPKPMVVVNRPGGAGTIGTAEIIRSKPDGYTIGLTGGMPLTFQPHRTKLPYGSPEEYTPIMKVVNLPVLLAARTNAPYRSLQEFLAYAKANPGKLSIGHTGIGAVIHLNAEMFKYMSKIDVTIVPFPGGAEMMAALLGGHIDAVSHHPGIVMPHVQAGKIRVLAVFEEKRNPLFPEAPTFKELGYDITLGVYYLVIGPKGIPPQIVFRIHDALRKAMEDPVFVEPMKAGGFEIAYEGPEDLKKRLMRDYEEHAKLVDLFKLRESK